MWGKRNSVVDRSKVEEAQIRWSFQKSKDEVICEKLGQGGGVGTGDVRTMENTWHREAVW